MNSPITPINLITNGRLRDHNIYRTATLSERETELITGKDSYKFPTLANMHSINNIRTGTISSCSLSLRNGNDLSPYQYSTLVSWNAGLSCQISLKNRQSIILDVEDVEFLEQFNDSSRSQNLKEGKEKFRILLVYELKKGTHIPEDIGIEQDGENHVCLYPTGNNIPVSNITPGNSTFTIDFLIPLQNQWHPYALLKVKANGFKFPDEFPPDRNDFLFTNWISNLISYGNADIAIQTSDCVYDYIYNNIDKEEFIKLLIDISCKFQMECDYDLFESSANIIKYLRYHLNTIIIQKSK